MSITSRVNVFVRLVTVIDRNHRWHHLIDPLRDRLQSHRRIRPRSILSRRSVSRANPGRDWLATWTVGSIMAKEATRARASAGTQGADHRRRLRHGRAAAIACARQGADVTINYLPAEEPDAREVVELIRAAERKPVPIPGDLRDKSFCKRLVAQTCSNADRFTGHC